MHIFLSESKREASLAREILGEGQEDFIGVNTKCYDTYEIKDSS